MTRELGGVHVAALTPRRPDSATIDISAALDLIDYYTAEGVDGITLLGTTGEFIHFDTEDRSRLASMAVKRSRVPVMVNVSHATFDGSLRLAEEAVDAGAAAVLLLPPHYFRYNQDLIREFYLQFVKQMPREGKLLIYNIPMCVSEVQPATSLELLATGQFAGIKDSSGNWEAFLQYSGLKKSVPFALFAGSDRLYARGRAIGWSGIVSGVASCLPDLMTGLGRAVDSHDDLKTQVLQQRLEEFVAWFEHFPIPVAMREAALVRNIKVGPHALPIGGSTAAKLDEFRGWLTDWLPQMQRDSKS